MSFLRVQWFTSSAVLWMLLATAAAQETPVIFEQSSIRIDPVIIERDLSAPVEVRVASTFAIELRSEDAAKLEYLPSLNALSDTNGVMIVFTTPILTALPKLNNFIAVDALLLAEDGTILSISPNIVLAELPDQELSQDPVKAMLFLKAGVTTARNILPKDVVVGSMFATSLPAKRPEVRVRELPQSPQTPAPGDNHPQGLDGLLRDAETEPAPQAQP